jgi:hypothetical protein
LKSNYGMNRRTLVNYTMSSYVPPHRRNVVNEWTPRKTTKEAKKEHRIEFPVLLDSNGKTVVPAAPKAPVISWTGISFKEDDVMQPAPIIELKDGWVNLRTYVPDMSTTSAQLNRCAENMLSNYRRYYVERGMEIPQWVIENPYDNFEDFDRTIPYETEYVSETDSSSEGEDPIYESDGSN